MNIERDLILTDGRVLLRRPHPEDDKITYDAVRESIPQFILWMTWCHENYAISETREWLAKSNESWEKQAAYPFSIFDAQTGALIGGCGLNPVDMANRWANLGYWVRSSRAGQGIAVAATRLLIKFGFEQLELNRIELMIATDNYRSLRVAEKAGAQREGILRKRFILQGVVHDAVMFSVIR